MGVRGRPAPRCRLDGRRLWRGLAAAHRHDGLGRELRRRHSAETPDVATRDRTEAERPAAEQYGASRRARSDLGQTPGTRSTQRRLANDPVARGLGRMAVVALRPRSRSGWTYPAQSGIDIGGMVADRVACRRARADQVLAVDVASRHRLPRTRRLGQDALAYRTRLSGTQTGGRARALRRARLAWLPSSRHDVHCGLWIPGLRAGDDSPLNTSSRHAAPDACHTRRLSTQRIPPCGLNGTSPTRSPPSVYVSSTRSSKPYRDALVAAVTPQHTDGKNYDAVR